AIFHQKYALHVAPLPLQMELSAITAESMIGQGWLDLNRYGKIVFIRRNSSIASKPCPDSRLHISGETSRHLLHSHNPCYSKELQYPWLVSQLGDIIQFP